MEAGVSVPVPLGIINAREEGIKTVFETQENKGKHTGNPCWNSHNLYFL